MSMLDDHADLGGQGRFNVHLSGARKSEVFVDVGRSCFNRNHFKFLWHAPAQPSNVRDLQHARSPKPLKRLCPIVLFSHLSEVKREIKGIDHIFGRYQIISIQE
jgi:hypothetical protein